MIHSEDHEIASHGYGHLQVYKQTKDEFLKDLLRSKSLIEGMTGEKVIGYRAPEWSICGALQRAEPAEGRWGLRIFFYRSIRRRIEELNRQGDPALIFLHPSDFDAHRPKIRLPRIKRFVCYGKIKTTEERITRLLNDFEFTTVKEALIG